MIRASLTATVTLVWVLGAGPATAQSMRDIVTDSEGGRIPGQRAWQQRPVGGAAQSPAPVPPLGPLPAEPGRPTTPAGSTTCVPPGMPTLEELVSVGHETLVAPVEGTPEIVAVTAIGLVLRDHLARYRFGETPLDFIIYLVRGHLAAVDDHPGDPSEPDLVDTGMVSPRGAALAQGVPMCQWERLPRTQKGDDRATTPGSHI
jgi:hypothetical protein